MNQIEIFNSPEFGSIRTLEQNGKVLFCGTDVATALGYTNPRKAVRDHTRGGTKCSIGVQTGKKADGSPAVQMVEMLFIPEGDLYRLIAHSKLPSAERFEQWVFDEVLPAIRKHGAYLTKEKLWEIATSPEALIKLCSELLAEREENASLREENALLESNLVFCSSNGRPMESQVINRAFNKLIKENGLPHVVFHSLRHSSITYKLKLNGGDMKSVQGDSGHAQVKMVADVYSHIIDEDRCINAQRLEEAFYSSKTPDPVEDTEPKTADTAVTESDESDAAKILELLKNPETAALLKQLAKAL